jgi:hypothetical protein
MKHTELKSFVRKYNSEFAIKGYSKMKKQPLTDEVKRVISKSRAEIQQEWRELNRARQQPKKKAKTKSKKQTAEDKKKQEQDKANQKADDAYHQQHKAGITGDQGRKLHKAVSRTEQRYRIQKDTALAKRIRGY